MSAIVKGGLFDGTVLATIETTTASRRRIAQLLGKKTNLALREIAETLNGVAPGQTASKGLARVAASETLGGVRAIETETLVNRVTTTGDRDSINNTLLSLSSRTYDPTPVPNGDGNPHSIAH